MSASNALDEKILMFVIGKSASPRCFKYVCNLPYKYRPQKKVWMDGALFEEWLCELDRKFEMQGRKFVMIVDYCPDHPKVSGLKAFNLQSFPTNTPSCTQLMDQGVIRYVCFIIFFNNKVSQIAIEYLDFAVEGLHCLKFFDYKDRSVRRGALWRKSFFFLRNATGHYQRIWDWISN